jgi:UDP-glucose 4-epimerase
MKILVTGGAGFIGHHLVLAMLTVGHQVTVLGRRQVPINPLPPGVRYVSGGLHDPALLRTLLTDVQAVAHLASATVPGTADKAPLTDVVANLVGTLHLLDAMVGVDCQRLLFLSSGGTVYGVPHKIPLDEGQPLAPIGSYGIVKVAIESYLTLYQRNHGLNPVIIRASNPYGPFQGNLNVQGIIGTYLNRALKGEPLEIWGDGSATRDYIHISDLTRLCLTALESEQTEIYNGGTGVGTSVGQIVELVAEVTGLPIGITYKPGRKLDVPVSILDIAKARRDLDWAPQIGLAEGIAQTWRWMRDHGSSGSRISVD